MERLEFVRSRAKNIGLVLIGLALVAAGLFMAWKGEDPFQRWMGWLCGAFFGLATVLAMRDILRGGTAYTFDQGGITYHDLGVVISWSEIAECAVVTIRGTQFLGILLRHPEQFLARESAARRKLARFNARMGWGHWALPFVNVSPGLDAAVQFIQRNVPSVPVSPAHAPETRSTRTT